MVVVRSLLARLCLWCCVLQYACVVVVAGLGQCAIRPDINGHVDIPSSWTSIGDNTFNFCSELVSVTIGDKVTTIGEQAFYQCYNLKSVTIGDSVTTIGYRTFFKCRGLTSVIIPDSVKTIGGGAFQHCSGLTSLSIGDSVTSIGYQAFSNCGRLTSVTIPDSVTFLHMDAFFNCGSLTNVTIGDGVRLVSINAFRGCSSLVSVTILCSSNLRIGASAFAGCHNLQNLTLHASNSITFGSKALDGSTKLKYIPFNDKITSITGLPYFLSTHYQCKEGERCGCQNGYGNNLGATMPGYFNCLPCSPGFLGNGTQSACSPCKEGTYADNSAQAVCTSCGRGTYSTVQGATSNTTCTKCPRGRYSPLLGSGECIDCPPGSFCNEYGLFKYEECAVGRYNDVKSRWNCTVCPAGRYQSDSGAAKCTECVPGKFSNKTESESSADCSTCEAGKYAPQKGSETCLLCGKDTFTAQSGNHTKCTKCPEGKTTAKQGVNEGDTGATTCVDAEVPCSPGEYRLAKEEGGRCEGCDAGKYSPSGSQCLDCPPGYFCDKESMSAPTMCGVGSYSDTRERQSCSPCPAGQFQNITGAAKCLSCPMGKYLPRSSEGATSNASCLLCPSGTYGDKEGLEECSICPAGQVQPAQGQDSCKECTLEGKIKTNNEARTACIDNQALLSTSLVETMFKKGVALILAFAFAGGFLCLAGVMHHLKAKHVSATQGLAALGLPQIALKSVLPGFSFGSELVLIMGIWSEAPGLGSIMLTFRLLHPICILVLMVARFFPSSHGSDFLRRMTSTTALDKDFLRTHMPPVSVLMMASMADCTMVQFLPWKAGRFYSLSHGYPRMDLMLVCMGVKTVQAFVSVVCQAFYLTTNADLKDPTMSDQAKALFGMNMTVSVVAMTMGLMLLLMKYTLLRKIKDEEEKEQEAEASTKAAEEGREKEKSIEEDEDEDEDGGVQLGDVYEDREGGSLNMGGLQTNPMHSAAMDRVKQQEVIIRAKDDELQAKDERIRALEAASRSSQATAGVGPDEFAI